MKYVKEPPKPELGKEMDRDLPGLWMTHDPAIYRDPVTGDYFIYSTGAIAKRSPDMIHWESLGKVVENPPAEAVQWTGSTDIWAPDIIKVGDEYRLYCSNSSWGVQRSVIFLAVSDSAAGPFVPRGIVLKTDDCLPVNGIDANIIEDVRTKKQYMVYGSFWGGIYIIELDKETGLAKRREAADWEYDGESFWMDEKGERMAIDVCDIVGKNLAKRPEWQSGAIEGSYIIYNEALDYYYLFVSFGSLKSDYQIRVGRSRDILGPFRDKNGRILIDDVDGDNTVGNLIYGGYQWNDGAGYMGPGHNSVLHDEDGSWYLVNHIREKNFTDTPEPSTMQIRKLYFDSEGWPFSAAEIYAEDEEGEFTAEELIGSYERITFYETIPQGISTATPMKLGEGGYYENCSVQGSYAFATDEEGNKRGDTLIIAYGPHEEEAHISRVYDRERECETIALCGINEKGVTFWAKKV